MDADEREEQTEVHLLDPDELKILRSIVLDLEELKHLLCIAKRLRVRSLLSSEITILHAKVLSNSTVYHEKREKSPDKKVLPDSTDQSASLNQSDSEQESTDQEQESNETRTRESAPVTDGAPLTGATVTPPPHEGKHGTCTGDRERDIENGTCFRCHQPGHRAQYCHFPAMPKSTQNAVLPNGTNQSTSLIHSDYKQESTDQVQESNEPPKRKAEVSSSRSVRPRVWEARCNRCQRCRRINAPGVSMCVFCFSWNLTCYKCGKHSHKTHDCPRDNCYRCGETGHWKRDCPHSASSVTPGGAVPLGTVEAKGSGCGSPTPTPPPSGTAPTSCYRCGETGHWKRDCPHPASSVTPGGAVPLGTVEAKGGSCGSPTPTPSPSGTAPTSCYRCGETGHWKRDCPHSASSVTPGGPVPLGTVEAKGGGCGSPTPTPNPSGTAPKNCFKCGETSHFQSDCEL